MSQTASNPDSFINVPVSPSQRQKGKKPVPLLLGLLVYFNCSVKPTCIWLLFGYFYLLFGLLGGSPIRNRWL